MRKQIAVVLGACLVGLFGTPASAVPLLEIVPTSGPWSAPANLPGSGSHDVAETAGASGWYAANLRALADIDVVFEYIGHESGWTNIMTSGGDEIFNTSTSSPGDTASGGSAAAGSWIDFALQVLVGGNSPSSVTNGANVAPVGVGSGIDDYGAPNFWLGYADAGHSSVYVAFDDGGGYWAGSVDDDNHDDLVFRVSASAIPESVQVSEPAALSLLGAGLLFTAFGFRRRGRAIR
jgi:hypothetical protein